MDGNPNKPGWEIAERIELVENITGKAPRQNTYARIIWNNQFLYVSFQGQDDFIRASYRNFNDTLYEEDVVEVFIDDNRDLKTYIEIEVNPLNAVLHYLIHNDLRGRILTFARTENRIITAVSYDTVKGIWYTEIAVPFSELMTAENIPPRSGDKWFLNLYRIDRLPNGMVEYSAWSPTGKVEFHIPECFGELLFKD